MSRWLWMLMSVNQFVTCPWKEDLASSMGMVWCPTPASRVTQIDLMLTCRDDGQSVKPRRPFWQPLVPNSQLHCSASCRVALEPKYLQHLPFWDERGQRGRVLVAFLLQEPEFQLFPASFLPQVHRDGTVQSLGGLGRGSQRRLDGDHGVDDDGRHLTRQTDVSAQKRQFLLLSLFLKQTFLH